MAPLGLKAIMREIPQDGSVDGISGHDIAAETDNQQQC